MNRLFFCFSTILLLTIFSPFIAPVLAGTVEDRLLQEGNEAYSRNDYGQAISKFEQIIDTKGYSAAVLYNLANSYALSGQIGKAVLNYERALRLYPSDSDISGNLELVKKENGLFPKEPTRAERFFNLLSVNQWTAGILLSLILITVFCITALKYPFSRQLNIGFRASCLLIFGMAITGVFFTYQSFNPSVVISPEVKMFVSPFESSATIGTLQEGKKVYPHKLHGDFSYITDETDRKGWVHSSGIEAVCPPTESGS